MHNTTRLKEPINQLKKELKAGAERTSSKSQSHECSNICWERRTRQNGKLLKFREDAQLKQSSEDHFVVEFKLGPSSMPVRLNMISVLNILSLQATKAYAHLP